ncbi:MAG TPA: DUF1036 domain-containing protein [Candidatus Rubrimentiphilum sp.]|nr:DUF1036 domain-containing protein [Candidatus Rubrimentiphilum sp.]
MTRILLIPAFLVFGALVFHPAPARAGMHFCNKTSLTVNVAMATIDDIFDSHVWGWWQVEPGACKTPIAADLDTSGGTDYYYYAYDTSGGTWSGGTRFCVDPNDAFDYNDDQDTTCASGTHHNFKTINTNSEGDFTVSLLP